MPHVEREYDFGKPLELYGLTPSWQVWVLKVARDWQSPGSIGCELATLASSRLVTDELGGDIARTIRQITKDDSFGTAEEIADSVKELRKLAEVLRLEIDI